MILSRSEIILLLTFVFVNVGSFLTAGGILYNGFKRKFKDDVLTEYVKKYELRKEYFNKSEVHAKFVSSIELNLIINPFIDQIKTDIKELKIKVDEIQKNQLDYFKNQALSK